MMHHLKVTVRLAAAICCLPIAAEAAEGEYGVAAVGLDPIVATIDGQTVSAGEYRLVMLRNVSDVFTRFKREKDLDDHIGYWKDTGSADSPIAALRQETLADLVRIKVEQALAKKMNVRKDSSFATFRKELTQENARRSAALAGKQVIYGPRQYSETIYYYVLFDNMAFQLRQELAKEADVPEEAVLTWFAKHRSELGAEVKFEEVKARILEKLKLEAAEDFISAAIAAATVEKDEKAIADIQPRAEP